MASSSSISAAELSNESKKSKKIVLRSSDGELFEVSEAEALQSETIKKMIDEGRADDAIPLRNVKSKVLSKVLEHCRRHVDKTSTDEEEKKEFKDMVTADKGMLFDLILAATYLNIKSLLDLAWESYMEIARALPRHYPPCIKLV